MIYCVWHFALSSKTFVRNVFAKLVIGGEADYQALSKVPFLWQILSEPMIAYFGTNCKSFFAIFLYTFIFPLLQPLPVLHSLQTQAGQTNRIVAQQTHREVVLSVCQWTIFSSSAS